MIASIVTELRKVATTRLWWILLVLMVLMVAGTAGLVAVSVALTSEEEEILFAPEIAYSMAAGIGYVFTLSVGTLAVTAEYRHQTITPTFLADPNRVRVVAGKALGQFLVGLGYGVAATFGVAVVVGGLFAITGNPTFLGDGDVLRAFVLQPLALALWALVGVGVGALIRNQIAAIVVIVAFNQLVDPFLRLGLAAADLDGVGKFLPTSASDAMAGGGFAGLLSPTGEAEILAWWNGGLVMILYAVVFLTVGWAFSLRRDVS